MQRERMWNAGVALALIALVAWSAHDRYHVLAASPYPLGVDGYFYPVQVRALLETGSLQFPSSPLTFWWMAPFAAATDPIAGAKLAAALGTALIAVPAYGVGARLGRSSGAGLLAAILATTSAGSAYLAVEFVKQGIGLTVALAALWLVLRAIEQTTRPRMLAAIAGICAALLAHKMAAAIVIAIAIPAAIEEGRGRGRLRGRRLLYMCAAAAGAAIIMLILGLAFPQRFISPADLALVGDLFTSHARWSAPALAVPNGITLTLGYEALIGAVLAVVAALVLRFHRPTPRRHAERTAAWIVVVLALVIGLPWLNVADPQGLAFRLRTAAFVPAVLCAAIFAPVLVLWIRERGRDPALIAIGLAIRFLAHAPPPEGQVLAHPALVAGVMAAHVPPGKTVIVPERHILFMVAWYTRAQVSLRPEPVPYADRVRMMPLAFIGMGSPLDAALDAARVTPGVEPPIGLHPRHRNGLVLVTEPTWDWLIAHLPPDAQDHWRRWPTI